MEIVLSFVHLAFVGFVSLFPAVNPISAALKIDPFLDGLDETQRKVASRKIAYYCFIICAFTLIAGSWLFKLFGISLPVVQIAGGVLICQMGWQMLSAKSVPKNPQATPSTTAYHDVADLFFYPLAFPMTTGAGTISVLLTLSAHGEESSPITYYQNLGALMLAVLLTCFSVFICCTYSPKLLRRLGQRGEQIVNRLTAFLVFCVGLQISVNGIFHLIAEHWQLPAPPH